MQLEPLDHHVRSGRGGSCLARLVRREEREAAAVEGTDRAEVALVKRRDPLGAESVRKDDDGEIRQSRSNLRIRPRQPRDRPILVGSQTLDAVTAGGEILEERMRGLRAAATGE
jgi:hypothetical protein